MKDWELLWILMDEDAGADVRLFAEVFFTENEVVEVEE